MAAERDPRAWRVDDDLLKPENGQAAMRQLGMTEIGVNPRFA